MTQMTQKSKQGCIVCQIVNNQVPSKKIYEDELVMAVMDINGANPGHCFVMPKNHCPIFEQLPDHEIERLFNVSNKISMSIFESLGVQGTNLFVANGLPAGQMVAHFIINVIPRRENDGINLQWQPKMISEEETSLVELKLKDQINKTEYPEPTEKEKKPAKTESIKKIYTNYF